MNIAVILGLLLGGLVGLVLWGRYRIARMTSKQKKALIKTSVNNVFSWFEEHGLLPITPAFDHEYHRSYPKLKLLEDNWEDIRDECLELLQIKDKLTDLSMLGGAYTQEGVHTIEWKSFMFKSGKFIPENCLRAPKTAALLRQIPGVYTAFFSILGANQYIQPHWGYYKGFLRYHLGVVIPNDNASGECFIRVASDPRVNAERDRAGIEKAEAYYWKNGRGIILNDNYLHDARNDSEEPRAILWLDLRRPMPFYLQWFNMLCLYVAHRDESVKKIRKNTLIEA